jgi:hypothetical protein
METIVEPKTIILVNGFFLISASVNRHDVDIASKSPTKMLALADLRSESLFSNAMNCVDNPRASNEFTGHDGAFLDENDSNAFFNGVIENRSIELAINPRKRKTELSGA